MPRLVAALREFLSRNFDVTPAHSLNEGVGYFITGKLPLMLAAGGGGRGPRRAAGLLETFPIVTEVVFLRRGAQ